MNIKTICSTNDKKWWLDRHYKPPVNYMYGYDTDNMPYIKDKFLTLLENIENIHNAQNKIPLVIQLFTYIRHDVCRQLIVHNTNIRKTVRYKICELKEDLKDKSYNGKKELIDIMNDVLYIIDILDSLLKNHSLIFDGLT